MGALIGAINGAIIGAIICAIIAAIICAIIGAIINVIIVTDVVVSSIYTALGGCKPSIPLCRIGGETPKSTIPLCRMTTGDETSENIPVCPRSALISLFRGSRHRQIEEFLYNEGRYVINSTTSIDRCGPRSVFLGFARTRFFRRCHHSSSTRAQTSTISGKNVSFFGHRGLCVNNYIILQTESFFLTFR